MDEYLESILSEPFTILGRRLLPLTLGHLLILNRLEVCPVEDNDDLLISVLVCSTNSTKLDDIFDDKFFDLKLRWWRFRLGEIDWIKCHTLWSEYFKIHLRMPSWGNNHKGNDTNSGTPFFQTVKITLQAKCGYSPDQTLTTPYQQCLWDYLSFHEIEGNIDILDKGHRNKMKDLADSKHDDLIKNYFKGTLNNGS